MKKKVLITGSSGFLGGQLVRSLASNFDFDEISQDQLTTVAPSRFGCETMIHLAGISSVPECEQNPLLAYEVNCALSMSLAESFFKINPKGHFIFASTGQVYSDENEVPYSESSELKALSVYARTKLLAEQGLKNIAGALSGRLTILRLFNQTHKSQSQNYFLPSIFNQLLASREQKVHIKVGNIDVDRDLSAVGDFKSAMKALLTHPAPDGIQCFNLCSGTPKNLREIALKLAARLNKEIVFEVDATRVRTADRQLLYGNSDLFQKTYGWSPQSKSIDGFLDGFLEDL